MRKRPLCWLCLMFLVGNVLLLWKDGGHTLVCVPEDSIFAKEIDDVVLVTGQVYKKATNKNTQQLFLKKNHIWNRNQEYFEPYILIYEDSFQKIPIGKTITLRGTIKEFERARNPGNFDQRLYYAKENIYGFIWCEEIIELAGEEDWFREALFQWKEIWKQKLLEQMSEKNGPVLSAILLAEKGEMDASVKELYQKNGMGHILAISGLHISFIGLGIYQFLRRIGVPYGGCACISVLILGIYVCMIGFSVSVIRAFVMLLFRIGADFFGRIYDMVTALSVSAALIIGYQPLYLTDAGFYLSYGAILGILLFVPILKQTKEKTHPIWGQLYTGIAIQLATVPVTLWFFYEISLYSFLANLVVIPLTSWILGMGICGSFLSLGGVRVGNLLLKVCDALLLLFEQIGLLGYQIPYARVVTGRAEWWQVILYYLGIGIVLIWFQKKSEKDMEKWCLVAVATGFIFLTLYQDSGLEVTMLDVGQGDCIYVKAPNGMTCLIDGGSSDVKDVGKYRIEPYLRWKGTGELDYVFLTHGDKDHCNGVEQLLMRQREGIKIRYLVLPTVYQKDGMLLKLARLAMQEGIPVLIMRSNDTLELDQVQIKCLHPAENMEEGNASSLVLSLQYEDISMLFTGDVEGEGENMILNEISTCDVLKVAHHGSKYSTAELFLKQVTPKISLISVGKDNSYGHPHKETISRLEKIGSIIFETDIYGAITLKTNGDKIDIFAYCR